MYTVLQDLRYALRQLTRSPGFTALAVVSLALGIGANAAIFSLFHQVLLRPLDVPEPHRLVNLTSPGPLSGSTSCGQAGGCDAIFSYPMFRDLEAAQEPFTGIAAHRYFTANLGTGEETSTGGGLLVSGSYFPVLGLTPTLGRLLGPEDDRVVGGHPVAVVSHRFWETRLGADPRVLDRPVVVNGHPLTVVGVAPPGFDGTTLGNSADVFVPLTMRGVLNPGVGDPGFDNRRVYWAYVFGRLKPGVEVERAEEAMTRVYQPILEEVEAPLQAGMAGETLARFRNKEITLEEGWRGQSTFHEDARPALLLLLGITGAVVLITCANLGNLLLARGARRSRELAIRGALGAGRGRLVAQLLTEACLLAVAGGAASLLVASWTLSLIGALLPPEVGVVLEWELSSAALGFAAALSLGTGLLFGIYPALNATRSASSGTLASAGGRVSGGRADSRFRTSLVTAQIALSTALLIAAGLFVQSMIHVSRVDLGLRADRVATFAISPGLNGYRPDASRALFERVEEELAALPGVMTVSSARYAILQGSDWSNTVSVQGFDAGPGADVSAAHNQVGPDYFRTLGIPLLAGREFTEADAGDGSRVAIVNEAFVRKFGLDTREALGARMAVGSDRTDLDLEIVGVVADAAYSHVTREKPAMYFTPWRQATGVGGVAFYARTAIDPATVLTTIPALIGRLDPNLPVRDLSTLRIQARENVFQERMISTLAALFAALATLLAAVGLYGVMAYTVAQRTREIGIRMALGAGTRRVRRMVLSQVGRITLAGTAIGLVLAFLAGRAMQALLFEVQPHDPRVLLMGTLLLAAVALIAGYLPARRAARVEPMIALRNE